MKLGQIENMKWAFTTLILTLFILSANVFAQEATRIYDGDSCDQPYKVICSDTEFPGEYKLFRCGSSGIFFLQLFESNKWHACRLLK